MSARRRATAPAPAAAPRGAPARPAPVPVAKVVADHPHLAGIHLRLGSLALARAELEDLALGDRLDVAGLADLAEARWRMGDLDKAAEAAAAHLAANGDEPIARVIAAEAAAAAGRPGEARTHSAAVGGLSPDELEARFAGMPRRALWPPTPSATSQAIEAFAPVRAADDERMDSGGAAVASGRRAVRVAGSATAEGTERADAGSPPDLGPGLWPDDAAEMPPRRGRTLDATPESDPAELLGRGRAELRSGSPDRLATGLDRLGLALRLDPTLAPGVLEAVGRHREPAALLLRGDAYRILGRTQDAEAAYLAAASALDGSGSGG